MVVEESADDRKVPKENALKSEKLEEGAVTFLDVLGWKGIWREDSFDNEKNPLKVLASFVDAIRVESTRISNKYKDILDTDENRGKDSLVEVLSISDTIVLFTLGRPKETIGIHSELCSWAIENALKKGLPLRGAIGYGRYDRSLEDNIMIGPAIDEAAAWHESTDWIGVILTPSAQMQIINEQLDFVISYDKIPFKTNIRYLDKCVKWNYTEMEELYETFISKGPHMQEVAPKYLNTLEFLNKEKKQTRELQCDKRYYKIV